jgi:hypothetical protein
MMLCLFSFAMPVAAFVVASSVRPRAIRWLLRQSIAAASVTAFVSVPFAVAIAAVGKSVDLERVRIFLPKNEVKPWLDYLVDPFPWGSEWKGTCVELGRFLVAGVVLTGALHLARRPRVTVPRGLRGFLFACLAVYGFLQLPAASPLLSASPLLETIQFPWRLLGLLTPLLIVLFASLVGQLEAGSPGASTHARVVLAWTLGAQLATATSALPARYAWFSGEQLEATLRNLDGPPAAGEFLPRQLDGRLPSRSPQVSLDGCSLVASSPPLGELERRSFREIEIEVESQRSCTVHLAAFATPLLEVIPSVEGRVVTTQDATLDVLFPTGRHRLTVRRVGLLRTVATALTKK